MVATSRFLLATSGLNVVRAHMQLEYPPPFNASNNPYRTTSADDIYVYPMGCCGREDTKAICRGYLALLGTPEGAPVATWAAGSKVIWNITGDPKFTLNELGATHYGGSCQVGFSLDKGKTFKVAASYEGDCPHRNAGLESGQDFEMTIPEEIAAGEAVFAWAWVNREQEFTMNCAAVTITNDDDDDGNDDYYSDTGSASSSVMFSCVPAIPTNPYPSTPILVRPSTHPGPTPAPSSSQVIEDVAKRVSLDWCSCDCGTASMTLDGENAYRAKGCTCECRKNPNSVEHIESDPPHHAYRRLASSYETSKQEEQQQHKTKSTLNIKEKRAAAWAGRADLFIPDPVWHDCRLPATSAELKYPRPGDQLVEGDGQYPLQLPSSENCVSKPSG